MTQDDLEILKHMMNGATPPEFAVRLLEDICARTHLDWKARHVYLQKRRNKSGADSWQAVLSIDGFRAAGARQPEYAGQEGPLYVTASDGAWTDIPPDGAPYAAKCGVKKKLSTGEVTTTWGVAKFKDYYAGMMWDKFPSTMTAKCAEMLAWRKTFPATFGGLYGDAEMEQTDPKKALHDAEIVAEVEVPKAPSPHEVYMERLQNAPDLDAVIRLGQEIQKDKSIEPAETFRLHALYTKMKKKYGGA